jgi:zinc D-Ala-D-Ala carboxypeptidase
MENISTHITYAEAVKSNTAHRNNIQNTPDSQQLAAMKRIAQAIFEPLRAGLGGHPIAVTSFFRSKVLNYKLGGSKYSQHCKGQAIDLDADVFGTVTNLEIFHYILENLEFDQLIWEFDNEDGTPAWVHVSLKPSGNRHQVLKSEIRNNQLIYIPYKEFMFSMN